jgi:GT2 family glycosyltransferase
MRGARSPAGLTRAAWRLFAAVDRDNLKKTLFYLRTYGVRSCLEKVRERLLSLRAVDAEGVRYRDAYGAWIAANEPGPSALAAQRAHVRAAQPIISIVVPVYNTPERFLKELVASVRAQTYPAWQLCIADGGSTQPHVQRLLRQFCDDPRILATHLAANQGIAGNTNAALSLASGDFVALLDHDDLLPPFALFEMAEAIENHPEADFLYSDEDKVREDGGRFDPHFKPDWAPDTLRSHNYICHLAVFRRDLLTELGGLHEGLDGSQDHDLFLRAGLRAREIVHIPKVLYHWRAHRGSVALHRDDKSYATDATIRVLRADARAAGVDAEVGDGLIAGTYRVAYGIANSPRVGIVINADCTATQLRRCVTSLRERTAYRNLQLAIAVTDETPADTGALVDELSVQPDIATTRVDNQNFGAIANAAISTVDAEHILLLNARAQITSPEWVNALLEHSQRRHVGATGAKVHHPDGTIYDAGVAFTPDGSILRPHAGSPDHAFGYLAWLMVVRNVSAVTGACMMISREALGEVGGFDEFLSREHAVFNLCLELRQRDRLIVWTPYAEICLHDEPRDYAGADADATALFESRWRETLTAGDPYLNPNLTPVGRDLAIRL